MHPPSPPSLHPSSLGHINHAEFDEPEHNEARLRTAGGVHARSPSWDGGEPKREILRAGDELIVIERHEPDSDRDDYDWYDGEGMRVRIREISR